MNSQPTAYKAAALPLSYPSVARISGKFKKRSRSHAPCAVPVCIVAAVTSGHTFDPPAAIAAMQPFSAILDSASSGLRNRDQVACVELPFMQRLGPKHPNPLLADPADDADHAGIARLVAPHLIVGMEDMLRLP